MPIIYLSTSILPLLSLIVIGLMETNIAQWNIRGYRTNYQHLRLLLAHTNAAVTCLQECRMPQITPSPPRGFQMYHKSGPPGADNLDHGGVCILVKDHIGHLTLPLTTDLQAVAVRCQLDCLYTICSLYLPPNKPATTQQLIDLIQQLPPPFLILGDFNARHPLWGDSIINNKGNVIESLLNAGLCGVLNGKFPTHFHSATDSFSSIDLSLCSPEIIPNFNWTISCELYNSDHFPIKITLPDPTPNINTVRYNYFKADWTLFQNNASCNIHIDSFPTVDDAVEYFNSTVISAADLAIPKTTGRIITKPVPWWNENLQRAQRKKVTTMRRYYRTRLLQDKVAFNQARAQFHFLQKNAQRKSWQEYVSGLSENTAINKVWKKIKKIQGRFGSIQRPVLHHNNTLHTEPQDVANTFAHNLSNVSQGLQDPAFLKLKKRQESVPITFGQDDGSDYNISFTMTELRESLRKCSNTAAGEDEIHYSMIKNLPESSLNFLLKLYNRVWHEAAFPIIWKVAIVLPFLKPGKDNLIWLNYRPIALTSCLCKLLEKMANDRLMFYLEQEQILHPNQYGFRKGHSCPDSLARIDQYINQAFARKQHVLAVFFDIEKAYDTTWKHLIISQLQSAGLCGPLPKFIHNFLTNRTFKVKVGPKFSDSVAQYEGVPQGSVLSCTLFALAINGLATCMPASVETSLYVDDFAIFTCSAHLPSAERRIQLALNVADTWTKTHGFKFSATKTVAMHFTRLRGVYPAPSLKLAQGVVNHVTETKFLGMTFDSKLYWSAHIKKLRTRCLRSLQLLNCLSRMTWGADRTTLLRVYRSLIRSQLDYGCQIYGSATATTLKTLDSIHHQALRIATGAFRSSPVESLYAEAGEPSLSHRRDKLLLQMYTRLLAMPGTPTHLSVTSRDTDILFQKWNYHAPLGHRARNLLQSLHEETPNVMPSQNFNFPPYLMEPPNLCQDLLNMRKPGKPATALKVEFNTHSIKHNITAVPVYTDGSKNAAGVGFAAVFPGKTISGKLPHASSVFTAELRAILPAVTYMLRLPQKEYVIYSDSQSAIRAISNPFTLHPIIREIHRWIRLLQSDNKTVTFCWVPGHVGVPGNEEADRHAVAATNQTYVAPVKLPTKDYYAHFTSVLKHRWLLNWRNIGTNKLRYIKSSVSTWNTSCRKERFQEIILSRVRIGHTKLTHQHLMANEPPPFCDNCIVPLTISHILTECPDYLEERKTHFKPDNTGNVSLRCILGDAEVAVSALFAFLRNTGLLMKM